MSYQLQQRCEFKAMFCFLARCSSNGAARVEESPPFPDRLDLEWGLVRGGGVRIRTIRKKRTS